MVECNLPKVKVASSILVSRFFSLPKKSAEIKRPSHKISGAFAN